jgi:hypothetical protein
MTFHFFLLYCHFPNFQMGLNIYIKGEVKRGFWIFKSKENHLEKIAHYFEQKSKGIMKDFLKVSISKEALTINVHPCEEPVYFDLQGNTIVASAKTNSVGPGYHAYLVEFLEELGQSLNIEWQWDLEEGDEHYCDEAEYYQVRNFEVLQEKMVHWLQALIQYFLDDDSEHFKISFPANYPNPKIDYYAMSPVGIWSEEWLISTYQPPTSKVMKRGEEFFIWWNKEMDGLFYLKTATALLNVDCPWHLPANEEEEKTYRLIDRCLSEAARLGVDLSAFTTDWETVKANLTSKEPVGFHETAFGYKKYVMTHYLAGEWRIDFPGYFWYGDDDGTDVYFYGDKTIRNTSYSREKPLEAVDNKIFVETFFKSNELKDNVVFNFEKENILGKAYCYYYTDTENPTDQYWILSGVKSDAAGFILTTICFNEEQERDWALEVWNSVVR